MSSVDVSSHSPAGAQPVKAGEVKLEVVEGRVSGPAAGHADYGSFASFSDPDGNGWLLQEIKTRLPGR
jgi:hypothetical protein